MKTLTKIVDTFVWVMMVGSAFALSMLTIAQVISRFVFRMPIPWSTDVIRMTFAYAIFFGAAHAAKNNDHLSLDILLVILKPKAQRVVQSVVFVTVTLFCLFIAYQGWQFTIRAGTRQTLPYLMIPMGSMYIAIAIGGGIMAFYYLQNAVKTIRQFFAKNCEG